MLMNQARFVPASHSRSSTSVLYCIILDGSTVNHSSLRNQKIIDRVFAAASALLPAISDLRGLFSGAGGTFDLGANDLAGVGGADRFGAGPVFADVE